MKKIIILIVFCAFYSCTAQIYPLRTFTDIPPNAYLKDTNNELVSYEGMWKGSWNNKTIYIAFKKINNKYNVNLKYYKDFLIAKFKVLDEHNNILFDNTNTADIDAKITGGKFRKIDGKYSLGYLDMDLCGITGYIMINFTDATKTKLNWKYNIGSNIIREDCPYYNTVPFPDPLPKEIVLIKQ